MAAFVRVAAVIGVLVLAGCQESTVVCPYLRQYPQSVQEQALAELQKLPKGSALRQMIGDYATLRDQVRACQQGRR